MPNCQRCVSTVNANDDDHCNGFYCIYTINSVHVNSFILMTLFAIPIPPFQRKNWPSRRLPIRLYQLSWKTLLLN
jgi:hypothetical protein